MLRSYCGLGLLMTDMSIVNDASKDRCEARRPWLCQMYVKSNPASLLSTYPTRDWYRTWKFQVHPSATCFHTLISALIRRHVRTSCSPSGRSSSVFRSFIHRQLSCSFARCLGLCCSQVADCTPARRSITRAAAVASSTNIHRLAKRYIGQPRSFQARQD